VNQELLARLKKEWPEIGAEAHERICRFHMLLAEENEKQNLTRLISPKDFFEGHVIDVKTLLESKMVRFPAMDLGSGCGVPGLLAAIIQPDSWVLAESERHKAEFLFRMVREFGLSSVRVVADRGENFLAESEVPTIVARAVGPVERIFGWLEGRSTWNSMILLKGPGWGAEWETFNQGRFRGELQIDKTFEYVVGDEKKQRILVKLDRVPRGA
jgi:16S rRNA (guanine(527)-N(7))-methyltransferase RsmG